MTEFEVSFQLRNARTGEIRFYVLQLPVDGTVARRTADAVAQAAESGAGEEWAATGTSVREIGQSRRTCP